MKPVVAALFVLLSSGASASAASVCIANRSGQELFLVADDLAGHRVARLTKSGDTLCIDAATSVTKAAVGVFASENAEEGCSRLTHPGQPETLLDFVEFDRCQWADTDRSF